MTGHSSKLFRDKFALNGDLLALFAHHCHLRDQRLQFFFQPIDGFHSAIDENRDGDHGDSDHDKRQRNDHHHPEQRIVGVHL